MQDLAQTQVNTSVVMLSSEMMATLQFSPTTGSGCLIRHSQQKLAH
jgi:hypothetical protein